MTGKSARRDEEIAIIELARKGRTNSPGRPDLPAEPFARATDPDRRGAGEERRSGPARTRGGQRLRYDRTVRAGIGAERAYAWQPGRSILKNIGNALLVRHRVSGPVEVAEKPDVLWDKPHLERLYARLEDEYELKERAESLNRKLAVIAESAQVLTNIIDTRRSLRLEVIIVLLILFEVIITIYQLAVGRHG